MPPAARTVLVLLLALALAVAPAPAGAQASGGSVSGRVLEDADGDGQRDAGEPTALTGETVFSDEDDDGHPDPDEPSGEVGADGAYRLAGVRAGPARVRLRDGYRHRFEGPYTFRSLMLVCSAPGDCVRRVEVVEGEETGGHDFLAYMAPSVIVDAREDRNGNGSDDYDFGSDSGDPYLAQPVRFEIVDRDGRTLASEAADGAALHLTSLPGIDTWRDPRPGTVLVRATPPPGYVCLGSCERELALRSGDEPSFQALMYRPASVSGVLFDDRDRDGTRDADEPVAGGRRVYLDLDDDRVRDAAEPTTVAGGDGSYAIAGVRPHYGEVAVRVELPDGESVVAPAAGHRVVRLESGTALTHQDLGTSAVGQAPRFSGTLEIGTRDHLGYRRYDGAAPSLATEAIARIDGLSGTAPMTLSYRWARCDDAAVCRDIPGADEQAYSPRAEDAGQRLRVTVTARNAHGSDSQAGTSAVMAIAPYLDGRPTVTGRHHLGQELVATPPAVRGASSGVTWEWARYSEGTGWTAIAGAVGDRYTLTADDVGALVTAFASASNEFGTSTRGSVERRVGVAGEPPMWDGEAAVGRAGDALVAAPGPLWGDAARVDVQWIRCDPTTDTASIEYGAECADVPGATHPTYTPGASDVGARMRVRATAVNPEGQAVIASLPSEVVQAPAPAGTVPVGPEPPATLAPPAEPEPSSGGGDPPAAPDPPSGDDGQAAPDPGAGDPTSPAGGAAGPLDRAAPPRATGPGPRCPRSASLRVVRRVRVRGVGRVQVSVVGQRGGALRLTVRAPRGAVREVSYRFDRRPVRARGRGGSATIRPALVARPGTHRVAVRVVPRLGRTTTITLRVRVGCEAPGARP